MWELKYCIMAKLNLLWIRGVQDYDLMKLNLGPRCYCHWWFSFDRRCAGLRHEVMRDIDMYYGKAGLVFDQGSTGLCRA